ncbi:MAG: rod shape-determining protein MreD [Acidimicrobiia bacterium]
MIRRIKLGLLILVAVVLQTTLLTHFDLFDATPGLCLLCVLAVAFEDGPESGALFGFAMGLALDLFLITPLGLSALSFALTGYAVGAFQSSIVRSTPWLYPMIGGLGGLFGGFVFIVVGGIVGQEGLLSMHGVQIVVVSAVWDAILAPLVFPVVRRIARLPEHSNTWRIRG